MKKMVKQFSVLIPTSVHIKKFLHKEYGNPIKIDCYTLMGIVIISLLEKQSFHVAMHEVDKKKKFSNYIVEVVCKAPLSMMKDYGHCMSIDKVVQINRFYEKLFYEKLFLFVQHKLDKNKRKMGVQDAINEYCDIYGIDIDTDISYDAMKKAEYRNRHHLNNIFRATVLS